MTYIYDTSDATCSSFSSAGDLVEKRDEIGNVTCMRYDALHRITQITYPAGSYASVTSTKCFVYDSATVDGTGMANAKARLAEAYTTTATSCTGTSKTVDEGFGYSPRGEVSDVYESTPNSGGFYHVNATYWAHGKLNQLSGIPSVPAILYGFFGSNGPGLDGEGRYTRVALSGSNPDFVSFGGVVYNNSGTSQPIGTIASVTYGDTDNDAFQYDPNTGRMTGYTLALGGSTSHVSGALTWNTNGTLQQLKITDAVNSGSNSQTCTYGYDDLARITSANCGSVWSQTFGLDPFGNLTKSGSANFQPTYNTAKNQYSAIPGGSSTAYDANGNLTNDVTHSYTWDADGNMISVDTVTMIYDALDRMVEQNGGARKQILYGPDGMKLALMNGQTLMNAFFRLPGGGTAVYGGSVNPTLFRHPDHLGSSRFGTNASHQILEDVSYAPYGEDYGGTSVDLSFTGQNQDTVFNGFPTNLYDFPFREYRTADGRWISPDRAGLAAVNPANPQTWNRYAYANNNPLRLVDPSGLDTITAYCGSQGSRRNCISLESLGNGSSPVGSFFYPTDSPFAPPAYTDDPIDPWGIPPGDGDEPAFAPDNVPNACPAPTQVMDNGAVISSGSGNGFLFGVAGVGLATVDTAVSTAAVDTTASTSSSSFVFYSGGPSYQQAATDWAAANNGTTIFDTSWGNLGAQSGTYGDWAVASEGFANQASGQIQFFGNNPFVANSSIWYNYELPALSSNPSVTGVTINFVGPKP